MLCLLLTLLVGLADCWAGHLWAQAAKTEVVQREAQAGIVKGTHCFLRFLIFPGKANIFHNFAVRAMSNNFFFTLVITQTEAGMEYGNPLR
jgi:hypothetical protein